MTKEPKTPNIPAKEKAQEFLSNRSKEDAVKEVTQIIYFCQDWDSAKIYWTDVLNCVNEHVIKKQVGSIG